jgi:hypothetical protein
MKNTIFALSIVTLVISGCAAETAPESGSEKGSKLEETAEPSSYAYPSYTVACMDKGHACDGTYAWNPVPTCVSAAYGYGYCYNSFDYHPACGAHVNNCGQTDYCGGCPGSLTCRNGYCY